MQTQQGGVEHCNLEVDSSGRCQAPHVSPSAFPGPTIVQGWDGTEEVYAFARSTWSHGIPGRTEHLIAWSAWSPGAPVQKSVLVFFPLCAQDGAPGEAAGKASAPSGGGSSSADAGGLGIPVQVSDEGLMIEPLNKSNQQRSRGVVRYSRWAAGEFSGFLDFGNDQVLMHRSSGFCKRFFAAAFLSSGHTRPDQSSRSPLSEIHFAMASLGTLHLTSQFWVKGHLCKCDPDP
eukprot:1156903-Pelagomonas_calceolata.AAC.10